MSTRRVLPHHLYFPGCISTPGSHFLSVWRDWAAPRSLPSAPHSAKRSDHLEAPSLVPCVALCTVLTNDGIFCKKLLQNPTAKADDETVITLGLTLMLTSATSSSSSFILRVILEVLTSTNLSLSCRRSTDEKFKKKSQLSLSKFA